MAFAIDSYTGDGTTATFTVTFPYISQSHVKLYIDGVEDTAFTWDDSTTARPASVPANGEVVTIERTSNQATRLTDHQDATVLTETTLDADANQVFYISQEAIDNANKRMGKITDLTEWDATSIKIRNVTDPTNAQDAATRAFVQNEIGTAAGVPAPANPADDDKYLQPTAGVNAWVAKPTLESLEGLTLVADRGLYATAADTLALFTLTAAGRAILDDASAAAQRTTLGLVLGTDVGGLANDQAWTGSQRGTMFNLTDAATVTVDFADGNNLYVTVAGDRTIGQPSNQVNGQAGFIVVEQDATGGRTTSWHADWDFGADGTPAPDTSANKKAVIAYFVDWDTTVYARFIGDF